MADTNTSGGSNRPKLSLRSKRPVGEEIKDASPQQDEASKRGKAAGEVKPQGDRPQLSLKRDKETVTPEAAASSEPASGENVSPPAKPRLNLKSESKGVVPVTPPPSDTATAPVAETPDVMAEAKAPTAPSTLPEMPGPAQQEPPKLPPSPAGAVPAPKPVKLKAPEPTGQEPAPSEQEPPPGHRPFFTLLAILALIVVLGGGVYVLATGAFFSSATGGDDEQTSARAQAPAEPNGSDQADAGDAPIAKGPKGTLQRVESVTNKVADNVALYDEVRITEPTPPAGAPAPGNRAPATQQTRASTPSADAESFLMNLTVSMVRTSSEGARIMVGSVIYHQGDVLDPATGLTLVGADSQQKHLIFRDSSGVTYRKPY